MRAQTSKKPYFIACKTIIAQGANLKAGSEKSHGSPLGSSEIEYLKNNISFDNKPFEIEDRLLNVWREASKRNKESSDKWEHEFANLNAKDKEYLGGVGKINCPSLNLESFGINNQMEATRVSSGKILQELVKHNDKIICGSADLALSNNVFGGNNKAINAQDFSGNFIHYGVREHAMAAIMNGLALSGFLPIGGTFFVFSDYMRPSIRLAAIMRAKVIYIMTHDSIGVGEDGPTHQPIEQLASFRAMPNIKVFRPADFVETFECYIEALNFDGPSILALSRQNLKQLSLSSKRQDNLCAFGAYVISEAKDNKNINIVIFASGSEVSIALEVTEILEKFYGKSVRVISVPCFENLHQRGRGYLNELVSGAKLKVAIEAGSSLGWHKIIGVDGMFFGMDQFGLSASAEVLYNHFGLTPEKIVKSIITHPCF